MIDDEPAPGPAGVVAPAVIAGAITNGVRMSSPNGSFGGYAHSMTLSDLECAMPCW